MNKKTEKNKYVKNKYVKTRKNKFKILKCAPKQENKVASNMKGISCYGKEQILHMKNIWNSKNSNKIFTNNPKEIWSFFKDNLSDKCYNELCWLNNFNERFNLKINKNMLIKNIFRPFSPDSWKKEPYKWLSSVDIINVMSQYEKKYENFSFIGPTPIDFDDKKLFGTCVWERLCKFDLNIYIEDNIFKIGIIFNTDPHYKNGKHWIALFIDIKKRFIFYFDSNGDKIPKRIKVFVDRILEQGNKLNITFKFMTNEGKEHQLKDGSCGIYVLYFIIELLKGTKEPGYFKKYRIPDEAMKDYRKIYYNTN